MTDEHQAFLESLHDKTKLEETRIEGALKKAKRAVANQLVEVQKGAKAGTMADLLDDVEEAIRASERIRLLHDDIDAALMKHTLGASLIGQQIEGILIDVPITGLLDLIFGEEKK